MFCIIIMLIGKEKEHIIEYVLYIIAVELVLLYIHDCILITGSNSWLI